jgi:phage-related protein
MAGFGSSIKLTGESEYQRALKQINQNLREVSSEMKVVSSSFDKNDKSTQAIAQKSDVLNKKLEEQKNKLSVLTQKYNEMNATYGKNSTAQQQLTNELTKEKSKLEEIGATLGKTSKEYQEQEKVVNQLEDKQVQYNNAVSKAKTEMNQAQAEVNKTTKELNDLGKEEVDVTKKTKETGDGFTVFKGILANLGTQAINSAMNGLKSMGSALVNVGKQAIESYADYEQLVGGVDTLFKDSSKKVQEYANNSYKTAGISANQYMEQITSFSASLISSLGGDTEKASEYGNRAIIDMSDNANKMGTDISMLQNAYQGFAKQNYTMLDNLKLGYGGTKTEMQRLIKDASKMTDVQKELGITVDGSSMSFGNIVNAISVMQKQMGIAGTTSKEASTTIEGSVNSMKSAWQNLLTGLADDNANFGQLVNNFVNSIIGENGQGGVLNNLLPRIHNVIEGIGNLITSFVKDILPKVLPILVDSIAEMTPTLVDAVQSGLKAILNVLPIVIDTISQLIPEIISTLLTMLPQLLDIGIKGILSLIKGLKDALPQLIEMLPTIIKEIVNTLLDNLPLIIETGVEVLVALINGLSDAIPQLIDYVPEIVETIVQVLLDNLPLIIDASVQIMVALVNGLVKSLPKLIAMVPQIITTIVSTLTRNIGQIFNIGGQILASLIKGISSYLGNLGTTAGNIATTIINKIRNLPNQMFSWGKDMINGLINGIKGMIGKVGDAVSGVANKIKSFLHFSRPDIGPLREYEQWMPDFIQGLTNSLDKASPELINQVKQLSNEMSQAMQPNMALNGSNLNEISQSSINTQANYNSLVEAFTEALEGMKIELDDEEVGSFVKKTVENAIYT